MPPPRMVPAVDIPVLKEVPGIEVPMPGDACGSEPPAPEQVAMPPIASPSGDAPDVSGLTPDDVSSVAPIGILVGATGEPGPTPSGEVIPSAGPGKTPQTGHCRQTATEPPQTAASELNARSPVAGACVRLQRQAGERLAFLASASLGLHGLATG